MQHVLPGHRGCPRAACDCSYKGGLPGFVQVLDANRLAFPIYDGNGMYKSLGNMLVNPAVGMLFIDFQKLARLRLNGTATIHDSPKMRARFVGAEIVVVVRPREVFPNCPRYVHSMTLQRLSVYAPKARYSPPEPAWKKMAEFRDVLPQQMALRTRKKHRT